MNFSRSAEFSLVIASYGREYRLLLRNPLTDAPESPRCKSDRVYNSLSKPKRLRYAQNDPCDLRNQKNDLDRRFVCYPTCRAQNFKSELTSDSETDSNPMKASQESPWVDRTWRACLTSGVIKTRFSPEKWRFSGKLPNKWSFWDLIVFYFFILRFFLKKTWFFAICWDCKIFYCNICAFAVFTLWSAL